MRSQKNILIQSLKNIEKELEVAENKFNTATDPILIDSYTYQIKSLHMRYKFYVQQLKKIYAEHK